MELDYYHQKVNVRVVSRVAERLRKLGDFKKTPETLGFDSQYPADHPKDKFYYLKICKKSALKYSIEKHVLFNFVNLSTIFCPRLQPIVFGCHLFYHLLSVSVFL